MYKIPLIKPYLPDTIRDAVFTVLESGCLTEGSVTKEFENSVRRFIECGYCLAVTSATVGLEIALRAIGVSSGDEVIVPDYTYPATAAVSPIIGATSVIVDINRKTMNIDYDKIENAITDKTKAIIPVSLFGNPLNYERLSEIKKKYKVFIIEDAACSLGADYKGKRVGNFSDITVFSCHPRKFITTGEGGIVTTDNTELAEWMNSYKHFGMNLNPAERGNIDFEIIGTNYKLSNILAAIGLEQIKIVDDLLAQRRALAKNYIELLHDIPGIALPEVTEHGIHSYQTFSVFVANRNEIMRKMRELGIEVQIGTYSLHMHKAFNYDNKKIRLHGNFENSKFAFNHCLALPMYHEMTESEQQSVVKELIASIKSL
jgi:dTDP-4-amino-4,6-dideoxygalactose transaminase